MRFFLTLVLLPLVLLGCGYTPISRGPGIGVSTLFIEPLDNETTEPFLNSLVTDSLRERFARDSRITLVNDPKEAEGVLGGSVSTYSRSVVSYDRNDNILEYRSQMTIDVALRRSSDGKILWKNVVAWTEDSRNDEDLSKQSDNETIAIQQISVRLADQLYYRMQDKF